jgi:hypothetical protein
VSRALGDLFFKRNKAVGVEQQVVISTPHLQRIPRRQEDQFLLLASDGLWNVMSDQQACDFVLRSRQAPSHSVMGLGGNDAATSDANNIASLGPGLSNHISAAFMESMDDSCSRLTQRALDLRSKDNISVLVIELNGALSPAAPLPAKPKTAVTPFTEDSIAKAAAAGELPFDAVNSINGNMSRRQQAATAQASLMKTLAAAVANEAAAASSSTASAASTTTTTTNGSTTELKVEHKTISPTTSTASTASDSSSCGSAPQSTATTTTTTTTAAAAAAAGGTISYASSPNSSPSVIGPTTQSATTPSIVPVIGDSIPAIAPSDDTTIPLPGAATTITSTEEDAPPSSTPTIT